MPTPPTAGVVIPVRTFRGGRARLQAVLRPAEREELLRSMATTVVRAAGARPVLVVSSAPEVKEWAADHDLEVVHDPGSLDDAAAYGRRLLAARGVTRVVICHADLPHATTLEPVLVDHGQPVAVVVPCHHDDGTPVLSLPATGAFRFAYGPGSFRRHVAEAHKRGLAVRVLRDPRLGHDVDDPADLLRIARPDA